MSKELLGVALRNTARNRRRTVLNMIALTIGISIMIASIGWARGYFTTLYDGMVTLDTGQVQIVHREYLAEERRLPLDLSIAGYREQRLRLLEAPEVNRVAGRIIYELELGNGREYMPMRGRAVDPQYEQEITTIQRFIVSGAYLDHGVGRENDVPGVLIGETAADLLEVGVGDTVFLRVRDRFGAPNTTTKRVTGVFRTGYPLFDRYLVMSELEATAGFLRMGDEITHLVLGLERRSDPKRTAAAIADRLPGEATAYPWQRFAETMIAAVEADIGAFVLLIGIVFLLILLGILNSMSMAVRERGREIGTMRAIGLKKSQLKALLIWESSGIAVLSAVAAFVLGGAFAAYVQFIGFDLAGFMPDDLPIPFGDRFFGDYRLVDFLGSAALGVVTAILGSLGPARRAARMAIVDTMRSGAL